VNLVPIVRKFRIETKQFQASDCAVVEKCTVAGSRKLLRFDFLCWNAGNADLKMGNPSQNPQLYEFSPCHRHYHLKEFNGYKIYDCKGRERKGNKQAFCLEDSEKRSAGPAAPQFQSCNTNQGVSAGWADLYGAGLDCQWIDITGLADGEYTVEAQTNRIGVAKEDNYGDNFTWAGIRLKGNTVTEIPAPCYPEDCIGFDPQRIQAKEIEGRWKVVEGNHWILDFGSKKADAQKARKIIKHYGMSRICYVGRPSKTGKQLMMYFKIGSTAPAGAFPGEDAIPFNPANVKAEDVGGRWKVTDGSMWLLDFGVSEANARKSVWIIKKYGFTHQCFVGRPNAPMMYFRK
jgi:hypothetical protein